VSDGRIEVSEREVRRALARSFTGVDPEGHAWRGSVGVGETVVAADVASDGADGVLVRASARVLDCDAPAERLARVVASENAELVLGRFVPRTGGVDVENAIMAGPTMAAVEVQATVWTVGWTAASFGPRIAALVTDAVPVPPAPRPPAARLRDAAAHVDLTTRRVHAFLTERWGGFEHHPDWGFHGEFGSARVFVDVLPVLDDSTAVRASSPVLSQVEMTDGLALRLLELAAERPYGCFAHVPARGEVWFQHSILGDDLDRVELESAIEVVASVADGCDDDLAAAFGGLRYADLG
jgi:hypothetical protein